MVLVLVVYAAAVFSLVRRNGSQALDDRLRSDFRWAAEMAEQRPDGTLTWFDGDARDENNPWLQVWSEDGQALFRTAVATRLPVPASDRLARDPDGRIVSVPTDTVPFRVLSGHATIAGRPVVLQVGASEGAMRQELRELLLVLLLGLPLSVVAAGLGGYWLARGALSPVNRMAERARAITAERLGERLPVDNPADELGRLALVFNGTLSRLESSFEQMRRFTSDVSHELRTPLTAIRSVGEIGLREPRDEAAYREIIGSMLEDSHRLSGLVERLLALSRADTGGVKLSPEAIDLGELAENVTTHLAVLAEEKQQSVTVDRVGAPWCIGDRLVLRQALINLVDNAIKYAPAGGRIRVRVADEADGATLEVSDTGPGILPERQHRIFDRFYRGAHDHSGESTGSGTRSRDRQVGGRSEPRDAELRAGRGRGRRVSDHAAQIEHPGGADGDRGCVPPRGPHLLSTLLRTTPAGPRAWHVRVRSQVSCDAASGNLQNVGAAACSPRPHAPVDAAHVLQDGGGRAPDRQGRGRIRLEPRCLLGG